MVAASLPEPAGSFKPGYTQDETGAPVPSLRSSVAVVTVRAGLVGASVPKPVETAEPGHTPDESGVPVTALGDSVAVGNFREPGGSVTRALET